MSELSINKELSKYINNNVFITNLHIPLFEILKKSSFESEDQNLELLRDRLFILLKLPHQEFWCHVLYDQSVLQSLQSFLTNAKRPHELLLESKVLLPIEKEIYKLFYRLIIRLSTHKEVDVPEFSTVNFANLIYNNFIIDVPTMFDICSIFGEDNSEMIGKLLCGVLSCQSLYSNDIKDYVVNTIRLLNEKMRSISSNDTKNTEESTKNKVNQHLLKKRSPTTDESVDLLLYLIDFGRTWTIFLNCVESKTEVFEVLIEKQFPKIVEQWFEKIIPISQKNLGKFETKEPEKIKEMMSIVCYYLIEVWRNIFKGAYFNKLEGNDSRASEDNYSLLCECVSMMSGCQENPAFADALYMVYPIESDLNVIWRAINSDENQYYAEYISETLNEINTKIQSRNTLFSCHTYEVNTFQSKLPLGDNVEEVKDNSDISHIMEIYQQLTAHDIRAYMKNFDCTSECMLESLLDGAIDVAFVKELSARSREDQQMIENEEDFLVDSVLSNHRNIYDGDEFDTGKIHPSQIHLGKRQINHCPVVDSNLRKMILNIVERQNEEDDLRVDLIDTDLYNDEFDDVYGISHDGIVNEKDTEEVVVVEENVPAPGRTVVSAVGNNKAGPLRAHRLGNGNGPANQANGAGASSVKVEVEPVIMEPSDVRYSKYNKNQATKKRYQDHQPGAVARNYRQGSHAGYAQPHKKDPRPKGARNDEN